LSIDEKLKKTRNRAFVSYIIASLAILYLIISSIKGIYWWTYGSEFWLTRDVHQGIDWFINATWELPLLNHGWEWIPAIPFSGASIFEFYQIIIPPVAVFFICTLFIADHRSLKENISELRADVEKELALMEICKEAGVEAVHGEVTIDSVIDKAMANYPIWHDTWRGKFFIVLMLSIVFLPIGLLI